MTPETDHSVAKGWSGLELGDRHEPKLAKLCIGGIHIGGAETKMVWAGAGTFD